MRYAALALVAALTVIVPPSASAIVVRHDAAPSLYRADPAGFAALADLPESGHGVLISPQWVVTVAHAVSWQQESMQSVSIGGQDREVAQIVVHPDYAPPPGPGPDGSIKPIMDASREMRDIALVRLAQPVKGIDPADLYFGDVATGETVAIIGKGRGGTGVDGAAQYLPQRGVLRRASNRVEVADYRWISYRFDQGDAALPNEGSIGAGDSGGPVLIEREGKWQVVALSSWTYWDGAPEKYVPGRYALLTNHTRLAAYRGWIEAVTGIGF